MAQTSTTSNIERRVSQGSYAGVRPQIRSNSQGGKTLHGYAAVFYDGSPGTEYELWNETYSRAVERLMPGCFDAALAKPDDCRCLWNHDANHVLGRVSAGTLRLSVDRKGLRYEVDLPDTQIARDLAEGIRRGDIDGSSFGFIIRPNGDKWRTERDPITGQNFDVREVLSVELLDVSPVTYPAYAATTAGLRAMGSVAELRSFAANPRRRDLYRHILYECERSEREVNEIFARLGRMNARRR